MGTTTALETELPALLSAAGDGDSSARARLFELFYSRMRRLASWHLKGERADHTLAPTGLVHETFVRLFPGQLRCEDRRQLFALVSQVMRRILIDSARRRNARKRSVDRVSLDEDRLDAPRRDAYLLALDASLEALEETDVELATVVDLRFFGGYSVAETADVLGVSTATVKRRWRLAKAWLHREVRSSLEEERS